MKEIRETKMVEQTTVKYVADDGKEFEKDYECRIYEEQKNRAFLKAKVDRFMTEIKMPIFDWLYYRIYKVDIKDKEGNINKDAVVDLFAYFDGLWYNGYDEFVKTIERLEHTYIVCNDDWMNFCDIDVLGDITNFGKAKKTDK